MISSMRSTADWQRSYLCLYVECSSLSSLSQVQGSICSTTTCCANQFSFSSSNNSCSIKESNAGAQRSFDQFNKDFMPFSSHRYCTVTACVTACNSFVSLCSCSNPSYPRCISALLCIAQHYCTVFRLLCNRSRLSLCLHKLRQVVPAVPCVHACT